VQGEERRKLTDDHENIEKDDESSCQEGY